MIGVPHVMISSTFYDLRQVRTDLAHFIADELGYIPLLSELPSFPVDPDLDTIENCRARVERDADLFILVVGGRYGSIDDKTDKSITNLEFLAARQKAIPVYAFVAKEMLTLLPVWKANPDGDFSFAVDTPRVLAFVEFVRSQERVWTFPFETAQDITTTLRRQFAFLFSESLRTRLQLSGGGLPSYAAHLSAQALRLVLERAVGWEYRLFLQCWLDEVARCSDAIEEYKAGLALETAEYVTRDAAGEWILTRMHELQGFVQSANKLINEHSHAAFGPPGQPGNAERIVWVSKMLGRVLEGMLLWARRVRCARLAQPFQHMPAEIALFVDDLVAQLGSFPRESLAKVEEALASVRLDAPQRIELSIVFQLANLEPYERAFAEAVVAARS